MYPEQALQLRLSGYVDVECTVTSMGTTNYLAALAS
jgi:outer membrane biosynthesis protein TonB